MSQRDERGPARSGDEQQADEQQSRQRRGYGRSVAEWVTFGIAAAILLGVAGLVFFYWVSGPRGPAVLSISPTGEIRDAGKQYDVPFVVGNGGGRTAAAVQVTAELRVDGQLVETATQQFNYLAGGETQQGVFVFRRDPREAELVLGIASYKLP